jgi:arylsulfatase A-like enzyme
VLKTMLCHRRRAAAWLLLALFAVGLLAACGRRQAPNILVVVVDTLRADRLGVYGNSRGLTPFLDELARQGTVFRNAYAPTSWTCPSVASLLTSRYPSQHHVISFASRLSEEEVTMAEALQPLGYVGGGFSANFRLMQSLGYAQGFQQWQTDYQHEGEMRADELHRRAFGWLDGAWQASSGKPGLLYLQYMEPHVPYDPPEPYRSRFARADNNGHDAAALAAMNLKLAAMDWLGLNRDDVALLESLYDGEVAAVDAALRQLFAELDTRGFLNDAIVVITADHGEEFREHGGLTHGRTLYNETVRVPLLVLAAGYAAGSSDENVSLLDIAPTVLELAGAAPEARFEGRSLVPQLTPATWRARLRGWWRGTPAAVPDVQFQLESTASGLDLREHSAGILRDSLKLLITTGGQGEAYDLQSDPLEKDANPSRLEAPIASLTKELEADRAALAVRAGAAAEKAPLDESTKEKLRALGYHF